MAPAGPFDGSALGGLGLLAVQHLLRLTLLVLAVACIGGLPMVIWFQSTGHHATASPPPVAVIAVCAALGLAVLAAACWLQRPLQRIFGPVWDKLCAHAGGFALALLVGLVARALVGLWLEPAPASDGATYVSLARQLALEGSYGIEGERAIWPPGLPLLLAPMLMLGIPERWAILAMGLATFAVGMFGMRALLARMALTRGVGIALWVFALWPTYMLMSALPEKELIIIALLPWVAERTLVAMGAGTARQAVGASVAAGGLLGICMLTQPSFQLLPVGLLLLVLLTARRPVRAALPVVLATLAMLLVVTPWTWRNMQALGHPVLVSTNGGSVLYRANNELATGVYTERGTVTLEHVPNEVERDAGYKRMAREWITANPGGFAHLAAAKLLFFMGDDSYGAYAVFSRGGVDLPRQAYLVLKLATAVMPWMLLWLALGVMAWRWRPGRPSQGAAPVPPVVAAAVLALPVLYLAAIHSVAESGPKYHVVTIPMVCALLAVMLSLTARTAHGTGQAA